MAGLAVKASLAGVPLSIRDGQAHSWSVTAGLRPDVGVFVLTRARARKILAATPIRAARGVPWADPRVTRTRKALANLSTAAGPVDLVLASSKGIRIAGLYVLAVGPGDEPINTLSVFVADARWLWDGIPIARRYNVRRASGDTRVVQDKLVKFEAQKVVADITHERATLKAEAKGAPRPWKAWEVLVDCMDLLVGKGNFTLPERIKKRAIVVQDLVIFASGGDALSQVLAYLPGVLPVPLADGKWGAIDRADGSEIGLLEKLKVESGSWAVADRRNVIPTRGIYVGMERQQEIRFDFVDGDRDTAGATPPATVLRGARGNVGREDPTLEMVAPCPEQILTLASGAEVVAGTWLRFYEDLMPAIQALGDAPTTLGSGFTQADILRWYIPGFSEWLAMLSLDIPDAANLKWHRRYAIVQEHWRASFRLTPPWRDKVIRVLPVRAGLVDPETGTRSRADAWMDYTVIPTTRGLKNDASLGQKVTGWNVNLTDANAAPSPAVVTILDGRAGLLQVKLKQDWFGHGKQIVPGYLPGDVPSAKFLGAVDSAFWNANPMSSAWNMAVILTCSISTPNDESRLHWHFVPLNDAAKALGVAAPNAKNGPDYRILTRDTEARFAWLDSRKDAILQAVWDGLAPPEELLLNGEEVETVAIAEAARELFRRLPRAISNGSIRVALDGSIAPTGNLVRVTHTIRRSGTTTLAQTELELPPAAPEPPPVLELLPPRIRAIIQRSPD